VAAHAALRLIERLYDGRAAGAALRQLVETDDGGLDVRDHAMPLGARLQCAHCQRLRGAGLAAVQPAMVQLRPLALPPGGAGGTGAVQAA
jgi:hypothetical protein